LHLRCKFGDRIGQLLAEIMHTCFSYDDLYKPRKVGQIDLVFGFWQGFISRPVHARLQFSVCNG